ncbi:MAG: NHLP family bacteriocin export ABC transporter peptidase/permease/ATPase subunit [Anaerolineae bacterium]
MPNPIPPQKPNRVKTPTVLQMEAVECGAAALAIILRYHGKLLPLVELRITCGVSRDGSKASNIVRAARQHGLIARGYRKEPEGLVKLRPPFIIHWNFNHFLVVEGFGKDRVYLNDPAQGPRTVSYEELDRAFTGVVLTFEPGPQFVKSREQQSTLAALRKRLKGSERGLVYVVLAGLALVIPGLAIPTFSQIFVDQILIGGLRDWIAPLFIGLGLTAVMRGALTYLQQYYLVRLQTKLGLTTSAQFFWHILHLPIDFFNQRYAGEIGARVALNDKVAELLSGRLATNAVNLVMAVFYALLMFQYNTFLTLIGIAMALVNLVALRYVSRRRVDENQKLLQQRGKVLGTSMSGLQLIETLKATGAESDFFARWAGYYAQSVTAQQDLALSSQLLSAVPPLLSLLTTAIILTAGGLQVMDGYMTVGMLVAFQSLMASFSAPINQMVDLGAQLQEAEGNMKRLDDIQRNKTISQSERHSEAELAEVKLSGLVEFRNVTFGYSRFDPPLVQDFNLTIKPGARVALVGSSGSGKSTLARLAAGLYEPWSGDILFDGKPRHQFARRLITNSLAMVDQDIFLFKGTPMDNLTLWDQTIPREHVFQAAKDAAIHNDIAERSDGYESTIEEGGRNLSGGQRQRLEIARALADNPSILILDEAMSALDPLTEKEIDDNLRRRGCTCLIIAHRLSTIRDCDEIIVLDRGRVVQRGAHADMMRSGGPYAQLIRGESTGARSAIDSVWEALQ